ncbi:MAG: hypothetical protein M2R46_01131 [Verrucomicrobia subdivision 3 bacterium]|nr:hypothetical protein [Limisphaerales bacterium]
MYIFSVNVVREGYFMSGYSGLFLKLCFDCHKHIVLAIGNNLRI